MRDLARRTSTSPEEVPCGEGCVDHERHLHYGVDRRKGLDGSTASIRQPSETHKNLEEMNEWAHEKADRWQEEPPPDSRERPSVSSWRQRMCIRIDSHDFPYRQTQPAPMQPRPRGGGLVPTLPTLSLPAERRSMIRVPETLSIYHSRLWDAISKKRRTGGPGGGNRIAS